MRLSAHGRACDKLLENPNDQGAEKLALDIAKRYGVTDRHQSKNQGRFKGKLIPSTPRRGHRTRETGDSEKLRKSLKFGFTQCYDYGSDDESSATIIDRFGSRTGNKTIQKLMSLAT